MRKITITLDSDGVASAISKQKLGFSGEHNAVGIAFTISAEAMSHFCGAEYYRVSIDGQYSEKLQLQNSEVCYTVPQSVMRPPSVNCQLVGYIEADGVPTLIAKSSVVELLVDFSEAPTSKIGKGNDIFEKALSVCTNAAEKVASDAVLTAQYAEQAKTSAQSAANYLADTKQHCSYAENSVAIASDAASKAERCAFDAKQTAERLGEVGDALKSSAVGEELIITDISPIQHTVKICLSGDDISTAKVYKVGKNLFNAPCVGEISAEDFEIKYLYDEDCILINGTAPSSADYGFVCNVPLKPNKTYYAKTIPISGSVTGASSKFCALGVYDGSAANSVKYCQVNFGNSVTNGYFDSGTDKLTVPSFWFYFTAGTVFENYKVRIQLGEDSYAEYERFAEPEIKTPSADGTLTVASAYPTTHIYTNTSGVTIEAEYNRDINKAYAELINKTESALTTEGAVWEE